MNWVAEFGFAATLNGNPFATGEAGGTQQFNQVVAETGLQSLLTDLPNALNIERDPGQGRLYYRANLNVIQPVSEITGMNRGVGVSRAYYLAGQDCCRRSLCDPVSSVHVGDLVLVRVTLNLDEPLHYVQVEDYIPAGTEVLDRSLKTSQLGQSEEAVTYTADDSRSKAGVGGILGPARSMMTGSPGPRTICQQAPMRLPIHWWCCIPASSRQGRLRRGRSTSQRSRGSALGVFWRFCPDRSLPGQLVAGSRWSWWLSAALLTLFIM